MGSGTFIPPPSQALAHSPGHRFKPVCGCRCPEFASTSKSGACNLSDGDSSEVDLANVDVACGGRVECQKGEAGLTKSRASRSGQFELAHFFWGERIGASCVLCSEGTRGGGYPCWCGHTAQSQRVESWQTTTRHLHVLFLLFTCRLRLCPKTLFPSVLQHACSRVLQL